MSDAVTKQIFKISYDTSKTKDHTIDAELLGNAILNTSNVLKHADKVLNGEDSSLGLDVKANSEGSFVIEFVTWLNSGGINPLSVLGFASGAVGFKTVMQVLNDIRSRPVRARIDMGNGVSKLILADGEEIEADSRVAALVIDRALRKDLEKVVKDPLEGTQQARLIFKDELDNEVTSYDDGDFENFTAPSRAVIEEVKEVVEDKEVRFVKVNFYGASGWSAELPDGEKIAVKMKDGRFLSRIEENKKLSKGDLFVVSLKTTTKFKSGTAPSVQREILEVKRHRAAKDAKMIDDE